MVLSAIIAAKVLEPVERASTSRGLVELGAGETGLVGLTAASALRCKCEYGPTVAPWAARVRDLHV